MGNGAARNRQGHFLGAAEWLSLERLPTALRKQVRVKRGRNPEPSAAIIESQSSKTSAVRGDERGYDGGQKILGRKRHLLVATQGLLLAVKVHAANMLDRQGAPLLLAPLAGCLPRLPLIWADSGSNGKCQVWIKEHLGVEVEIVNHPWTGIKGVWAPEGTEIDWDKILPKGFQVLPRRWVVERTHAWISRCRRLARDFEGLYASAKAFLFLALSQLMLTRLAHSGA